MHHFTFDVGEQSLDAGADLTSRLVIVAIIQLVEKQEKITKFNLKNDKKKKGFCMVSFFWPFKNRLFF